MQQQPQQPPQPQPRAAPLTRIQRLELYNFKSYAGTVTIGPLKEFTCVVGPNGAGKSNIMDAISFVLSAARTGALRGRTPLDFVHRRAARRECAVTMVLRHTTTTTAAQAVRETAFTRRVDSAGGVSVYVDRKPVSERAFAAALLALGVDVARASTFVVFQHQVERVAQMRGKALTDLLEHVSGSAELRGEYASAKAALATAHDALTRASLDKRNTAVAVGHLRLAQKEAERYDELAAQLAQTRRHGALAELYGIERELAQQSAELTRFRATLAELQRSCAPEATLRELKRGYAEQHKAYFDALRLSRATAEQLRTTCASVEQLKATVAHVTRRRDVQRSETDALVRSDATRTREVQRLQEQVERQQTLLRHFDERCAHEDASSGGGGGDAPLEALLTAEQMTQYRQLRTEAECQTISLRQQAMAVRRQRESTLQALRQCELTRSSLQQQQQHTESEMRRGDEAAAQLSRRMTELRASADELTAQLAAAQSAAATRATRARACADELAAVQEQLHELRHVRDSDKQQTRMADALQALRTHTPGVRGRLVDLCTIVDDRYRNAVTVALGRHLDGVVVDTAVAAVACVRYLKQHKLPPMTFLPLDTLQAGARVDDRLRRLGGSCRPLVDVVQCSADVDVAVRYALGQTLVCDTLAEAKAVAYGRGGGGGGNNNDNNNNDDDDDEGQRPATAVRHKVVTLDGTVLLKSGVVQGGLAAAQSRARRWDERRYDDLRAARERLLGELATYSDAAVARADSATRELAARLQFAQRRHDALALEAAALTQQQTARRNDAATTATALAELATREADYARARDEADAALQQLSQQLAQVEQRVFAPLLQQLPHVPDVLQREERLLERARQRVQQRRELVTVLQQLQASLAQASAQRGGAAARAAAETCEQLERALAQHRDALTAQQARVRELEATLATQQAAAAAAKARVTAQERRVHDTVRDAEAALTRLAHARRGLAALQTACDTLRLRRLHVVRRCQTDGVDLPLLPYTRGDKDKKSGDNNDDDGDDDGRYSEPFALLLLQLPSSSSSSLPHDGSGNNNNNNINNNESSGSEDEGARASESMMVRIDFRQLSDEARRAVAPSAATVAATAQASATRAALQAYVQQCEAAAARLRAEMDALAPNLQVVAHYRASESKLAALTAQFDQAREQARVAQAAFARVREARTRRFMATYDAVAAQVDRTYQELTRSSNSNNNNNNSDTTTAADDMSAAAAAVATGAMAVHGSAYLSLENVDEPYLGGTIYHATPPRKRFMPMELLSGGEQTMAALALLFAMHAVSPSPFFVLDEVDAALDAANVERLARYLRTHCRTCQFVVVSLKDQLYHTADLLVGVLKDREQQSSRVLTMDLREYAY